MELEFQIPRNDVFSSHKPKLIQNKSGVKNKFIGVRQRASGKWVAEIKNTTQKIRMWLGTFDTAEEAARAYDEAASLLRGPNTRKNFVDHLPHNSTISMKVKSLLNQKRASKQNLTFTPKNPTNKTNQKTSSQKTSCVLPNGLNKDFNVIHEELPNYNFSSLPLKPLIETNIETGSQTSSPQSYSENTSPTTSGCWNRDFQIIDDDVYRPDLRQSLDGEEKMGSSQFGLEFGDAFHQILLTNEEFLAPISDIFESERSENQFPEFDRMKVERQISASLYAMNGVNEYWQNFNNPSDSLCDLPMVYHMFCSS